MGNVLVGFFCCRQANFDWKWYPRLSRGELNLVWGYLVFIFQDSLSDDGKYDDLKNSRLCKATAHVKLSDDKGNIIEDEFDIRYQYTTTVPNTQGQYANGIQMCGHDTEQLSKFLNEKTMILMLKKADKND